MAKIHRQLSVSRMNPAMVGPMAGASEITTVTRPIMRPRCAAGTTFINVVMSSGIMIAVPDAWITRATTRSSKPGAMIATAVPSEKRDIALMNIWRVVKRWSRNPVTGITTAIVSMNAVVSHCAWTAVIPRSVMRCGIATAIVVSLRIATKAATSKSQMTRFASGVTPEGCVVETDPVEGVISVAAIGRLQNWCCDGIAHRANEMRATPRMRQ